MELLLAFKSMSGMEYALVMSLLLHTVTLRLLYLYAQHDKVILLMADRSHRDMIEIDTRTGDYRIKQPLNKPRPE